MHVSDVDLFFGSGDTNYWIDPFGVADNNLVSIIATKYDRVYGDLPELLSTILVVLILMGLVTGAAILVPLFCTFGKKACCCQPLTELKDEIALLKYCKYIIRACTISIGLIMVVIVGAWIVNDKTVSNHSKDWLSYRVSKTQCTVPDKPEMILESMTYVLWRIFMHRSVLETDDRQIESAA